jgi:hypothetical protein
MKKACQDACQERIKIVTGVRASRNGYHTLVWCCILGSSVRRVRSRTTSSRLRGTAKRSGMMSKLKPDRPSMNV